MPKPSGHSSAPVTVALRLRTSAPSSQMMYEVSSNATKCPCVIQRNIGDLPVNMCLRVQQPSLSPDRESVLKKLWLSEHIFLPFTVYLLRGFAKQRARTKLVYSNMKSV